MLTIRGAMPFGLKPPLFEKLYQLTLEEVGEGRPDVGLQFVSSTKIAQLNARYAGKNSATDVLSFESDQSNALGDVVICSRLAQAQSVGHKVSVESELGLLFVHGLLHLLGHDHQDERGMAEMRALQAKIVQQSSLEAPKYP